MAEIKSTFDIIMEKAKKFSVTEEEKQGFKRHELEGKIKGLVQKRIDGILDSGRFQAEVSVLKEKDRELVDEILKNEVVVRLETEGNSEGLLMILENAAGTASSAVKRVLAEFAMKAEKQNESRRKALFNEFKKKGITGSAVLANLAADPEWLRVRLELKKKMQLEIREQLKSG